MYDDLYIVLGVDRMATKEEIRRKYKQLALECHPDKNPNNAEFYTKKFAEITNAYKVLIDDNDRRIYDLTGSLPGRKSPTRGSHTPNSRSQLDDLYDKFYGPSCTSNNSSEIPSRVKTMPQRNASCPINSNENIGQKFGTDSFYNHSKEKQNSSSSLQDEPDKFGEKTSNSFIGPINVNVHCSLEDIQNGSSKVLKVTRCREGIIETKSCTISLYPGIEDGTEIVATGQGNKLVNKLPENIVFKIVQDPHPRFKRSGNDLQETIHISLKEALLGFTLKTIGIDGKEITKNVIGPIDSGYKEVIPDSGMTIAKTDQRGNLIVKVLVDFPNALSPEQIQAIQTFF